MDKGGPSGVPVGHIITGTVRALPWALVAGFYLAHLLSRISGHRRAGRGSEHSSGHDRKGNLVTTEPHQQQQPPADRYKALWRNGHYGIYRLDPGVDVGINIDIVFLHGLQVDPWKAPEAWRHTWISQTADGGEVFWPAEWLPADKGLDHARILSVSYEANLYETPGKEDFDFDSAARAVLRGLIFPEVAVGWEGRKVVLVGYSMGGLMVNALVHLAASLRTYATELDDTKRRAGAFMENLRGLVYYATPNSGTDVNNLYDMLKGSAATTSGSQANSSLLRYCEIFSKAASSQKARFYAALHIPLHRLCFAETLPTQMPGLVGGAQVIVREASAYLDPCIRVTVDADHVTIVKPASQKQVAYQALVHYIRQQTAPKLPSIDELGNNSDAIARESWIAEVHRQLDEHKVVIVYGMGGAGKSTLTKMMYNYYANDMCFNERVWRLEVGNKPSKERIKDMKEDLARWFGCDIRKALDGFQQRFFLILDDVWLMEDLRFLLPVDSIVKCVQRTHSWLLITSRNGLQLATMKELHGTEPMEMPVLRPDDCAKVLKLFAGGPSGGSATIPKRLHCSCEELDSEVAKLVKLCHGLPLHLRILGSSLEYQETLGGWQAMRLSLESKEGSPLLKRTDPLVERARQTMVLSASLADDERSMNVNARQAFLAVALFFLRRTSDRQTLERWCEALYGGEQITRLIKRSLLMEDTKGRIRVHDALREYAQEYIKSTDYPDKEEWPAAYLAGCQDEAWHAMYDKARVLAVICGVLTAPLRSDIKLLSLVNVDIAFQPRTSLKQLQFLSLNEVPSLHGLAVAMPCLKVASLVWVDVRMEHLAAWLRGGRCSLQHLSLIACENLKSLPAGFGGLSSLQHLDLSGCYNLTSLPAGFGGLSSLQHLSLIACENLTSLPADFGGLSSLQHLDLSDCNNLTSLPAGFGGLSSLQHLDLSDCNNLTSLPESISRLNALKELDLRGCMSLKKLPEGFPNVGHVFVSPGQEPLQQHLQNRGIRFAVKEEWDKDV